MKILWLSHFAPYPPKGGALQRSHNMLRQLSREADVTLLSLAPFSKVTAFFDDYGSGIREIEAELSKFCKDVILVRHGKYNRKVTKILNATKALFTKKPYDVVWLESSGLKKAIGWLVNSSSFDAIHVDTIGLWPYVCDIKLPVLLNHHNIESHMLDRRSEMSAWPLNKYFKIQAGRLAGLENIACNKAGVNITCSSLDGDRLCRRGIDNTAVIPNGVDLGYFKRHSQYNPNKMAKLIFAGGLEWYPNRDAMLFFSREIWPLLKRSSESIRMTVVGKGSIRELNEVAARDNQFEVTGFVPDVRPYLEEASIYVCPIRDGGGTKLKVLDALAMGVPLVAHPVACEGIDVTEGENVIFAETAADFCSAITALSNDLDLCRTMSINGRLLIKQKYCYEKIGRQIIDLYRSVGSSEW